MNMGARNGKGFYFADAAASDAGIFNGQAFDGSTAPLRGRDHSRGFFWPRHEIKFRDILDGLANTIMAGEINTSLGQREVKADIRSNLADTLVNDTVLGKQLCIDQADPASPQFFGTGSVKNGAHGRGYKWADGRWHYTGFFTILPPNGPSCTRGTGENGQGIGTASSRHQGGAHVLMGDGAVKFITDSIDAGELVAFPTAGDKSPFGLWGQLGTRAGRETIDESF